MDKCVRLWLEFNKRRLKHIFGNETMLPQVLLGVTLNDDPLNIRGLIAKRCGGSEEAIVRASEIIADIFEGEEDGDFNLKLRLLFYDPERVFEKLRKP